MLALSLLSLLIGSRIPCLGNGLPTVRGSSHLKITKIYPYRHTHRPVSSTTPFPSDSRLSRLQLELNNILALPFLDEYRSLPGGFPSSIPLPSSPGCHRQSLVGRRCQNTYGLVGSLELCCRMRPPPLSILSPSLASEMHSPRSPPPVALFFDLTAASSGNANLTVIHACPKTLTIKHVTLSGIQLGHC